MMTEGEEYLWNLEFESMRLQVGIALNNLDNISKRNDVKGQLEAVYRRLDELCEQTQGVIK